MNALERRLKHLRRIRTELEDLGLDGAAEKVEDEIAGLEMLPSEADDPAVSVLVEAAMELEEGLNKAQKRGGQRGVQHKGAEALLKLCARCRAGSWLLHPPTRRGGLCATPVRMLLMISGRLPVGKALRGKLYLELLTGLLDEFRLGVLDLI